ncbi:MAG: hypothetical protein K0U41_05160, partial [Gammaproteobacteria bacterium]|nr:hypothetical protein [Gammaproteobacteria bacterium]
DKKLDSKFTALEKSIADVYRNTDIKFAALEKKVDSNFISLTKSIESLEKIMNAKFAAVDAKIDAVETKLSAKIESLENLMNAKFVALSKENKIYQKFTLGLGTLILGATFKEEIMTLVMGLFGG